MSEYFVRMRSWPQAGKKPERPWELLRDGRPIGFYETREEAEELKGDCEEVERRVALQGHTPS